VAQLLCNRECNVLETAIAAVIATTILKVLLLLLKGSTEEERVNTKKREEIAGILESPTVLVTAPVLGSTTGPVFQHQEQANTLAKTKVVKRERAGQEFTFLLIVHL
jgi:hypothetical protein